MGCILYFQKVFVLILLVLSTSCLVYAEDSCVDIGGVATGASLNIIYPQNSSTVSLSNVNKFNFSIKSDFYGSPITTRCTYGSDIFETNCSLELVVYVNLLNNDGSVLQDAVEFFTEYTPVTNSGEKTYYFESMCKNTSACADGKYSVDASIVYGCSTRPAERYASSYFTLHLDSPKIDQTYPANGMVITAYDDGKAKIQPSLVAIDSASIVSKKVNTGSQIIDLISNPNYEISLNPGQYNWNFSATDSFGNVNNSAISFSVIANDVPSSLAIQNFNYSSGTPSNGQNIISDTFLINLTATDPSSVNTVNVIVFNSSGIIRTLNDTNKKSIYSFLINGLQNGNYSFNASLINGSGSLFNLETRNIQISVPVAPTVVSFIIPPRVSYLYPKNNSFMNYSSIDFRIKLNKKAKVDFSLDGQSGTLSRQNDSLTFNYLFKNLSEGSHSLYLKLLTEDGNTTTRNISLIFTLDRTPPVIETNMSSGDYGFNSLVVVGFSAKDTNGIIKKWYNYGSGDMNYVSPEAITLPAGNHTVLLYAQDRAGNIQMKTVNVVILEQKNNLLMIVIVVISVFVLIVVIVIIYSIIRKKRLNGQNSSFTTDNYSQNNSGNI